MPYHPNIRLLACEKTIINASWDSNDYTAPYWRLYWNVTPGASVAFGGTRFALTPGVMVLIAPETAYRARCRGSTAHCYMHFLCESPYDAPERGVYAFETSRELRLLADAAFQEGAVDARDRNRSLAALALLHAALMRVSESALRLAPENPRIVRVLKAIEAASGRPVGNRELARLAGMNRNAFIRLFHEATGTTPHAWAVRRRIERACLLLHHSLKKVEEIAAECGFCDRYHFSRVFKRIRGTGPAEFRRRAAGASAIR